MKMKSSVCSGQHSETPLEFSDTALEKTNFNILGSVYLFFLSTSLPIFLEGKKFKAAKVILLKALTVYDLIQ